jgi:hypothetical protein
VPFVAVERIGGPDDQVAIDAATMAFHCYAADQPGANELGHQVIRAVYDQRGAAADGAIATQARKLSGPTRAAVTDPNLAHAVVLMQTRIKTSR